ncbi:MAG TPA: Holliday junction branch migration protein RuvA [Ilumatobacter sp.]|nr:Holliday junction branch migration protein RuvA [Ilumatobacter sp.]
MIGSLRGTVLERDLTATTAVVEVAGVGYVVHVTERTLAELEPGSEAFVFVHHHITEANQALYGFLARDERVAFQTLLKVNGVGPSSALSILATHPPAALVDIVASGDKAALTLVPGIGPKTAERLMVELKNRFSIPILDSPTTGAGSTVVSDVREALLGLGYTDVEVRDTLRELPADADAAVLLREALKALGARRA